MSIEDLRHVERPLSSGGSVIILNTGAIIPPDAEAMLQALHSRSIGGLKEHLKVLARKGPERFMADYYVGYGHKSIGDCGTVTIFVEGVSMLVAKAIQDWALYSGQEASTRYIDFAKQLFIDPVGSSSSQEILESWRHFYVEGMPQVVESLKVRFPRGEDEEERAYNKAINARALDIMRGFLPAGASTNLAWHTNFRQAADHLARLRHHPLQEVREVAVAILSALEEAFPSSFGHKLYPATEEYNCHWMEQEYYLWSEGSLWPEFVHNLRYVDWGSLRRWRHVLSNRPTKTELPKEVGPVALVEFRFLLDFASFRDIHRQRAVEQRMPFLNYGHGFEGWYLKELPDGLRQEATVLLNKQERAIDRLIVQGLTDTFGAQYYHAMGYKIPNQVIGDLHALVYLVELRATRFVHPTLRLRAKQMAEVLRDLFGRHGLVLHLDQDPDRFDVRRGTHDIVMKE